MSQRLTREDENMPPSLYPSRLVQQIEPDILNCSIGFELVSAVNSAKCLVQSRTIEPASEKLLTILLLFFLQNLCNSFNLLL